MRSDRPQRSQPWMYGKPGRGKTILCSTAIEHVAKSCESIDNAGQKRHWPLLEKKA
ncbi:uncharacterized protein K489DRAFT_189719 [Dissoconium aciculare CBS 342.82]|uniref:Nephrocystin 3-like N-terminal domain-containing protein n=1 Tax=Dissoconium aciculare CBS 342.82 TaxID=1314786 RepID=A0A6J3MAV4_9PEZI|nr:uncharacterized protein K489DRAFT_189719 [Dissoconium aciculare CBS 342.82]KAF1824764.1 hypothetical protein K489DRAFT_189719 [Dissoconium aciculare CBS 342.82]